jgi:hypothetical protein
MKNKPNFLIPIFAAVTLTWTAYGQSGIWTNRASGNWGTALNWAGGFSIPRLRDTQILGSLIYLVTLNP